ncbi:IclR family transcriptional regulator [Jiangella muralis]|uniref:IclR family transcriptional regulator n=1 Tax=Jiangella muralis TaxID=702383 RepID=UPI0009FA4AF0|nr:helix-turn-helix domain-containing protein [Jiangella muralis]
MLPAQPNQSLIDGLACLQTLASSEAPIGSREMARLLGLEITRVNRLLKTLAALGLAEQDERRKYRPGPAIHVLAAQSLFGSGLLRRAIGPMESLYAFGHVVALGVLWRDKTAYLFHGHPSHPASHGLGHERLYPAASSGIGLILLAHRTEDEVRALYADPPVRLERTIPPEEVVPDLDGTNGLLARLARIRADGWALAPIPGSPNRTLAVGLGDQPDAGIGVSGRFGDHQIDELLGALHDVADQIVQKEQQ